ncbi:hypothetical protein C0J52_09179 [Blattella germanica]|nr:hypothetical protein C0J52_09179 [Blattella germanica]
MKKEMSNSMVATLLVTLGVYIVLQHHYVNAVHAAPSSSDAGGNNLEGAGQRSRVRPFLPASSRTSQYMRARLVPIEAPADVLNDFVIDDDVVDFSKRQSEDYGHFRFGKREQFDDYGHMRFGRSLD